MAMRHYRPEPTRWWIRHVPAHWPGASGLWTHLAERSLGSAGAGAVPRVEAPAVSDVVYLPPVDSENEAAAKAVAGQLRSASVPVVRQRRPGAPGGDDEDDVLDLAMTLIEGRAAALDGLETECESAVWPLIPGLTTNSETWQEGLDRLAAAGLRTVVPMVIQLKPAERRKLADFTDDEGYHALFHGPAPSERAFCRAATQRGLLTIPRRPNVTGTPRAEFCRRAATELLVVADLWLRLGRPEAAGQNLLRAARWAEQFEHDLRAVVREGNLEILHWLDANARQVVSDLAADRPSELRRELEIEYGGDA